MRKEVKMYHKKLLNLGSMYVSDFVDLNEQKKYHAHPLEIVLDEKINAPRLAEVAPKNIMWGKYWYRSGVNMTMRNELRNIVETICNRVEIEKQEVWLDIACNDGTLLSYVPQKCFRIGIDPADDSYVIESKNHADIIVQDFFSAAAYQKTAVGDKKVKVITSIAVFYDLHDPFAFVHDIKKILDINGIWVLQLSYTPLMLRQLAFDNICHEHAYYYALENIKILMDLCELQIVDVELNDVNGGSFRLFVMHKEADISSYHTAPFRDVARYKIDSILEYEKRLELASEETWSEFKNKIDKLKNDLLTFLHTAKENGKSIWGYGASTKGNTLLQYFNINNQLIDGIAERNINKHGLFTIGTNIPIRSEEEMRKINPDYLLILPWHFIKEFEIRESEYLQKGGQFVIPCPKFRIHKV